MDNLDKDQEIPGENKKETDDFLELGTSDTEGSSDLREQNTYSFDYNKSKEINALHVNNEYAVLIQTLFDGNAYKVSKLEIIPLELPSVDDAISLDMSTVLKNAQKQAVIKAITNSGILPSEPFVSGLGSNKIIIKDLTIEGKETNELQALLSSLINSPWGGEETNIYEYIHLSTVEQEGVKKHRILGAVVDSSEFFSTTHFLSDIGINCNILDFDVMAVVNLYMHSIKPKPGEIGCVIDIDTDQSYLIIHSNGEEELYIRNLDFNYEDFKKILSKNRNINLEDADSMIKTKNFYDYLTKAFESETTESLNQHYPVKAYIKNSLLDELQKTIKYYSRQNQNKIPTSIYITGKGTKIKKLAHFLKSAMEFKCEELDVASFFKGSSEHVKTLKENSSTVYKAVGLSLRYE